MNWNEVSLEWPKISVLYQHKWNRLTNDDLRKCRGQRGRIVMLLEDYYCVAQYEAEKALDEFTDKLLVCSEKLDTVDSPASQNV